MRAIVTDAVRVGQKWAARHRNDLWLMVTAVSGSMITYVFHDGDRPPVGSSAPVNALLDWGKLVSSEAQHDLSNPYLAQRGWVRCARCLRAWPKGDAEPGDCPPAIVALDTPQEAVDRMQAKVMARQDFDRAMDRAEAPKPRPPEFEPGRNGLGSAIVGRWPW